MSDPNETRLVWRVHYFEKLDHPHYADVLASGELEAIDIAREYPDYDGLDYAEILH